MMLVTVVFHGNKTVSAEMNVLHSTMKLLKNLYGDYH